MNELLCTGTYLSVFADCLLIQSTRKIHFDEIISVKAIPCYYRSYSGADENDDETGYFVEVVSGSGKKIRLSACELAFLEAFQKYKNVNFTLLLTNKDVISKFGKTKYMLASFLFELSPFKITLWTSDGS